MNILVIDDEKDIRENVATILTKAGYNITVSDNVTDAAILIRNKKWDLVISDIMIPHLGGFDLVDLVKKISPGTPVIIATGMDKEVLNSTITKADVVLTKPFTGKQLTTAVSKLTGAASMM